MKPSYTELAQRVVQLETENARLNRQQQRLPGHKDLLQLVVEHTPAAIAILDQDLRYLSFSNRYLKDYGLKARDLLGCIHHEVFPDLPLRWKVEHMRCLQGERVGPLVDILQRSGGRQEWVKRELAPWYRPDGRVGGIIIFNEIITREREAIAALQESEQLYRDLVESIHDVIYAIRPSGKLTYISPSIESILGYTAEEIVGKHFLTFVDQRDRERIGAAFRQRPTSEVYASEFRLMTKDGNHRWVRSSTQPIYGEDSLLREFRGVVTDISQEKQAAAEHQQMVEQLQRAQRMEALGTLAGGVAHDLNNILSGIVSYPDLLLMDLPRDSSLRKPVETMKATGQRAAAVDQDLLSLAQRGVMAAEVVNLNDLIRHCLQSPEWLKIGAEHPMVRIDTRLETDLLCVEGSPVHLATAIINLLCNALDAIDAEGVIRIATINYHIEMRAEAFPLRGLEGGDYVQLSISDDGRSISETDCKRIFEPFYTRKMMGRSGTGLGMAVVWGTVTDHAGTIDLTSREGQGTTVSVTLPATRKVPQTKVADDSESYRGKGQSLLVVDDEEEQRLIATRILNRLGYHATAVESGEAALAHLARNPVDLVLLDMIMDPGIDGLETFRRIRAQDPDQAVILVSGYAQTERIQKALALGAALCLRKPYTVANIGRAVCGQFQSATETADRTLAL